MHWALADLLFGCKLVFVLQVALLRALLALVVDLELFDFLEFPFLALFAPHFRL